MQTTEPNALVQVVETSGLEQTKGQILLRMFTPYFNRMAEIEGKINLLNKDNPSAQDVNAAREIRISLMKEVRKPAEKVKDEGKKSILIEGRLYDNLYGVINNTSKGLEMQCEQIEKFAELRDLKMREERKVKRIEQLSPYVPDISFYDLLNMPEDAFNTLLATQRAGQAALLAQQKQEEEEKTAREKADAEAREAQRLENEKLKAEAAEKEKVLAEERAKAEAERIAADVKIKAAQDAQAKVEAELKAKTEAEEKAKREAEAKVAAEFKAQQAAEKKAAKAPDKAKLLLLATAIDNFKLAFPELKSEEAKSILADVDKLLKKVVIFIREKSETL